MVNGTKDKYMVSEDSRKEKQVKHSKVSGKTVSSVHLSTIHLTHNNSDFHEEH